ncbi:molybdopterin-guanine dinucleotide biosynthesis protein B [Bacillus taeanensis]|uniref:molybdopterin-guanine dinucleotide biosynthesis protein B n=1 Tax=Bacillus taeanensis TaxID=273032 RepID=UPI0015F05138|nr:molybdopterin-guanine dinucleotide biosynthesis protein B [Bacillus taeanensis]
MGITAPVVQVVGYQNSGKTTLIEHLLQNASDHGLKIGTIKHHGHGGKLLLSDESKDTGKHRRAGAVATSIEGEGIYQLTMNSTSFSLEKMIEIYSYLEIDSIIVEGFKNKGYPKVVLIRNKKDIELLEKCSNVKAVISWLSDNCNYSDSTGISYFHISQRRQYIPWIINKLMRGVL